jgi:hypothetical protein
MRKGVVEMPFEVVWVILAILAVMTIVLASLYFIGKLEFRVVIP